MDTAVAYGILGIPLTATYDEAHAAFRARAKLLHPDRAGSELGSEATKAMSQLTEAWQTVRTSIAGSKGSTTTVHDGTAGESRPPRDDECVVCGRKPAALITLRRTTGMVLIWRWTRFEFIVCRTCARSLYADIQASSLVRGWWGFIAPVANLVNLVRNRAALSAHAWEVGPPVAADPSVAPMSYPLRYRSPWTRPGALICTAVAACVIVLAVGGEIANYKDSQPPAATVVLPPHTGECLNTAGNEVDCSNVEAVWILTESAATEQKCLTDGWPESFTNKGDGSVWCAAHTQP